MSSVAHENEYMLSFFVDNDGKNLEPECIRIAKAAGTSYVYEHGEKRSVMSFLVNDNNRNEVIENVWCSLKFCGMKRYRN